MEYEAGCVAEYWLIDPDRRRAEFYQLSSDGRYSVVVPDSAGVYLSIRLPGLGLKVDWLWQDPLPKVLDVLRQLELI